MAIYDKIVMTEIVESIGQAQLNLQNLTDLSNNTSSLYSLRQSRYFVFENTTNTYLTNDSALEISMQSLETSYPNILTSLTTPAVVALSKYMIDVTNVSFKSFYKYSTTGTINLSGINFSDSTFTVSKSNIYNAFRSVWRNGLKEEIAVGISHFPLTSNSTLLLDSNIIQTNFPVLLDSALELRPVASSTGTFFSDLTPITLTITGLHANNTTETITVQVPANYTKASASISIPSKKFIKIINIIVPTFSAGTELSPSFDIWVV